MSSAPVRQTAPGTFAASISPPPSGVVATTSNVGSSIVSARAFADAAARTTTPSVPQSQCVQRAILSPPPAVRVGSLRTSARYTARPVPTATRAPSSLQAVHFNCSKVRTAISAICEPDPTPLAGWSDAFSLRPTESSLKRRNRESKVIPRRLVAPGGCVDSFACCGKATSANEKTSRPKAARASPKFGRPLASPWQPNYRLLGKLRFGSRNYVIITVGRGWFAGTAAASGDGKTEKRGSVLDKPRFIVITISRGLGLQ